MLRPAQDGDPIIEAGYAEATASAPALQLPFDLEAGGGGKVADTPRRNGRTPAIGALLQADRECAVEQCAGRAEAAQARQPERPVPAVGVMQDSPAAGFEDPRYIFD